MRRHILKDEKFANDDRKTRESGINNRCTKKTGYATVIANDFSTAK